jgi:methionyl-tRNA synthetase
VRRILDALELGNPRTKIDGSVPVVRETEHFFLDLEKLAPLVEAYLSKGKEHWRPSVLNFSRQLRQERLEGAADHPRHRVGYPGAGRRLRGQAALRLVRGCDRLSSASIEEAGLGGDPILEGMVVRPDAASPYYFIGKDNTVFHTVIWPAELIGVGQHCTRMIRRNASTYPTTCPPTSS